jgi:hypothetical protein
VERFRWSGQTVTQFCAAEGVFEPSFYVWKRTLAPHQTRRHPPRGRTVHGRLWVIASDTGRLQNTGNRPVRALSVKMQGYDKDDREVEIMPMSDYYIYATAGNDRPGIAPGETYHEPNDVGHVIAPILDRRVVRVNVKVVKVEEKVPE